MGASALLSAEPLSCLPFFQEDPEDGTLLSLAGWGLTHNLDLVKPDR